MVRALRARFSAAALRTGTEEPVDAEESQKEIQAKGELILGLGGRESNSPGKVWSSPSDVPAPLGAIRGRLRSSPWARHRPRRRRLFLFGTPCQTEGLKRGSDGGASQVGGAATDGLAEALKAQTAAH